MNTIFNGVFGSHLYGLNTPTSDKDYKGVFMPTLEQSVFNDYKQTVESQTKDIDTSMYSINKFVNILAKSDTVSFDMLHTPEQFILIGSDLWQDFYKNRENLYCKNMRGILSYVKTMASKYGHKVKRYEEMVELLSWVNYLQEDDKISETNLPELVIDLGFKYITFTPHSDSYIANIDVCGSRHQITSSVGHFSEALKAKIKRYGTRTKTGSEQEGDWKSLSHSVRVLIQLEEIIDTRDLVFPLVKAKDIMQIKLGLVPQDDVVSLIDDTYSRVIDKLESSDLPENNDISVFKDLVMERYL